MNSQIRSTIPKYPKMRVILCGAPHQESDPTAHCQCCGSVKSVLWEECPPPPPPPSALVSGAWKCNAIAGHSVCQSECNEQGDYSDSARQPTLPGLAVAAAATVSTVPTVLLHSQWIHCIASAFIPTAIQLHSLPLPHCFLVARHCRQHCSLTSPLKKADRHKERTGRLGDQHWHDPRPPHSDDSLGAQLANLAPAI